MILQLIEEAKGEKSIRKEIAPDILRDIILGSAEHVSIRGYILNQIPNLSDGADHIYDQLNYGMAEKIG
jgi:hypothetical protein